MDKKYQWHKIAESTDEIPAGPNQLATIEVAGKKICIAKRGGSLQACAGKCPHAGGTMADGYLDALGHIVCPLHRYKFDLTNGRNVSGEGYYLRTYPLENRSDGIYVGIPFAAFF